MDKTCHSHINNTYTAHYSYGKLLILCKRNVGMYL